MAVGIGREQGLRGAQMNQRAGGLALGEFMICDRGAQDSAKEIPIAGIVLEQIHRVFHFLVRLKELAPVEAFDSRAEVPFDLVHRSLSASYRVRWRGYGSSSLSSD